ncbi:MAG TPA: SxtJ family membrane protein [Spirochaetota bacterium]|nr:SxtJ family membrane protein [Spirochaetota bacterium]
MKDAKTDKRARDLETIGVIALALFIIHFILRYKSPSAIGDGLFAMLSANALLLSGILVLALGLASRTVAGLISDLWLKFSHVLGSVTNRIILSVIFFVFLTPIALLYRLFAANPLQLSREKSGASMYHERNYTFRKEDFEKMW